MNAAHAALAFLPAATRDVLLATGPRPADLFRPLAADALGAASELAVRSVLVDTELRAPRPELSRPWLDPDVLRVALAVPAEERLGRSARDGWLGKRLRRVDGWAAPRRAASERRALDAWLRGPLDPWLRAVLAPERVHATGAFHPPAVAEATDAWRKGGPEGGLDARVPFFLALLVLWLEREGLRGGGS
jgi:hypothetical protein